MRYFAIGAIAVTLAVCLFLGTPGQSVGQPAAPTFNAYVLKAVDKMAKERTNGGYDIGKAFTNDLKYGSDCCVKASSPKVRPNGINPTMCVAAVAEVIVEALNIYAQETGDRTVFQKLPLSTWTGGSRTTMRAQIFMFEGSGSAGTAHALQRLGLGRQKLFSELKAGDFINLNRSPPSGHAVIFLNYITPQGASPTYASTVVGFRYFSAQGKGRPDGGFGYRNAYFTGKCPLPRGRNDDCNVINAFSINASGQVRQNQFLLNTGEMYAPGAWRTAEALAEMKASISRSLEDSGLTRGGGLEDALDAELNRELKPDPSRYEDGSEI